MLIIFWSAKINKKARNKNMKGTATIGVRKIFIKEKNEYLFRLSDGGLAARPGQARFSNIILRNF